jgi:hypothetical protein
MFEEYENIMIFGEGPNQNGMLLKINKIDL